MGFLTVHTQINIYHLFILRTMAEPAERLVERKIRLDYVIVSPGPSPLRMFTGRADVSLTPPVADVVVLGVYDSGMVPDDTIPDIQTLTARNIPVFGVRQTLFVSGLSAVLDDGRKPFEETYVMQPEVLRAGLTPLQVYPRELLELADAAERLVATYGHILQGQTVVPVGLRERDIDLHLADPHHPIGFETERQGAMLVQLNAGKVLEYVIDGLIEVCSTHSDYEGRVHAAREHFNSPRFNERIDEALAELSRRT